MAVKTPILDAKIPKGTLSEKWSAYKSHAGLVNPANRRKYDIIVVGTGLAGSSAAASLAEMGYNVKSFCFQDSPRRAHSIAAQGGINAAKNYQNDGDSVFRLFYDTIKGGDYRAREANVHRLAELSTHIIDQCVAQGIPFAREYGGLLANRSFGGAQVSRTFYARGQTGQQLLLGAYSALSRQIQLGKVQQFSRHEILDLVIVEGKARGVVVRDLVSGKISSHSAHAVLLCTGGYGNVYFLSTNAMGSNVTACWRAHKKGAFFANPCFTQIHPTCIPVHGDHQSKLTLMSESLRNDGRVWVPKTPALAEKVRKGGLSPEELSEEDRDYFLERRYPAFGNLVPRDVASRNAKYVCDEGKGVGTGLAVFLDFRDAIKRDGEDVIRSKYGNLFDMYQQITGQDPYRVPMNIYPAVHYTMGGLWVDYQLMTTIPGLYALGEANFSDHGANRLGASALMQGLADGYFVIPYTLGDYLSNMPYEKIPTTHPAFQEAEKEVLRDIQKLLQIQGNKSVDYYHKQLGLCMWEYCGMSRTQKGLEKARIRVKELREEFWKNVKVVGKNEDMNLCLEKAGRVADFLELGELMIEDALQREESCGGHFREEYQTPEGEALRNDELFSFVSIWEYGQKKMHKEHLNFEEVKPTQRSYK
ncbi:MAG: fumarate reductase/succinate dehydrogenase flavoprotein subunit [Cytophagales bacterium]|nr:fumarate reductase/succinate dehydrogenase flavoprotein subunit [Cytophagales bacterium]